jgi:predicted Fe-Mo cluster-binding NifX family protein
MPHRLVIPVADSKGLKAQLAEHFGRAPYFAVIDLSEDGEVLKVTTVKNAGKHVGGISEAHDNITKLEPEAVVVYDMGPRGLQAFHEAGIAVLKTCAGTVGEVVAAYKAQRLEELIDGCPHALHG